MSSFNENLFTSELVRLQREMVALKSPQRYLTGQAKGYKSNTLRVQSKVTGSIYGTEIRELLAELRVVGDHIDKTLISDLHIQVYNSSGTPIKYSVGMWTSSDVILYYCQNMATDKPNEHIFYLLLYTQKAGTTDAFYADFWVVGNDSAVVKLESSN